MWNSQLYFLISEFAIATALLVLCDRDIPVTPAAAWLIVSLAGAHALRTPMDQLLSGKRFQNESRVCAWSVSTPLSGTLAASFGTLLVMGSDSFVIVIVLVLLFWETLGSSRQGCAYSLLQLLRSAGADSAALPLTDIFASKISSDGDRPKSVAVCMRSGAKVGSVASGDSVAASSDACPVYSKRWLAADFAIVLGIALIQVPLIGML